MVNAASGLMMPRSFKTQAGTRLSNAALHMPLPQLCGSGSEHCEGAVRVASHDFQHAIRVHIRHRHLHTGTPTSLLSQACAVLELATR